MSILKIENGINKDNLKKAVENNHKNNNKVKCSVCNGAGQISVNIGAGISLRIDTCYTCNGRGVIDG